MGFKWNLIIITFFQKCRQIMHNQNVYMNEMIKLWHHLLLQDVLQWRTSRRFFYWRLRRLLLEEELKKRITAVNPGMTDGQTRSMISRWFVEAQGAVNVSVLKCAEANRNVKIVHCYRPNHKSCRHNWAIEVCVQKYKILKFTILTLIINLFWELPPKLFEVATNFGW